MSEGIDLERKRHGAEIAKNAFVHLKGPETLLFSRFRLNVKKPMDDRVVRMVIKKRLR